MKRYLLFILLTALLTACGREPDQPDPQSNAVVQVVELEPESAAAVEIEATEIEEATFAETEANVDTDDDSVVESEPVEEATVIQAKSIVAAAPETIEETAPAETTNETVADWTDAWVLNETGETSGIFSNVLVNVTSVEIREIDGKQYQCITASGIPNYQTTITQQILNTLLARPNFATDFANGIGISVGDIVGFGEDIGYTPTAGCVSGNEGSGYWPKGPACPVDIEKDQCFPMDPEPTSDICETALNDIGTWANGVAIFNWEDGMSYQNGGVWVQEAFHFENNDMDIIPGHAPPGGNYHHHSNPVNLGEQLGDEGLAHSPIYGFVADGYPVYGPWHANGELANSCWKTRDYDDANSATGCGVAGERSCLLVDQHDITQGVEAASSNGPNTYDIVSSASGNPFITTSGYYFQDYYYDSTCTAQGEAYLDEHNGHDHDGLGYHYHVTISDNGDGTYEDKFPFYVGPRYAGVLQDNAVGSCSTGAGQGGPPPGGGGGGGGQGGPPPPGGGGGGGGQGGPPPPGGGGGGDGGGQGGPPPVDDGQGGGEGTGQGGPPPVDDGQGGGDGAGQGGPPPVDDGQGGGDGGGQGGPPPVDDGQGGDNGDSTGTSGSLPDFAIAAAKLNITEQALWDALGGASLDIEAAAEALGLSVEEIWAAMYWGK